MANQLIESIPTTESAPMGPVPCPDHTFFTDNDGVAHGCSWDTDFPGSDEDSRCGVIPEDGFATPYRVGSHKLLLPVAGDITIKEGAESTTHKTREFFTFPVNTDFQLTTGAEGFSYLSRKVDTATVQECEEILERLHEHGVDNEDWEAVPRPEKFARLQALIGNTSIETIIVDGKSIIVKRECDNASGSHYDRVYIKTIQKLEEAGYISPGDTLCDITTGSAGSSLALIGTLLGYNVRITIPQELPANRVYPMVRFGATVVNAGLGYLQQIHDFQKNEVLNLPRQGWKRTKIANPAIKAKVLANETERRCYLNHSENELSVRAFAKIADELADQAPEIDELILGVGNWTSPAGIVPRMRELKPGVKITGFRGETRTFGLTFSSSGISFPFDDEQLFDAQEVVSDAERQAMRQRIARPLGHSSILALVVAEKHLEDHPDSVVATLWYDKDTRYQAVDGRAIE